MRVEIRGEDKARTRQTDAVVAFFSLCDDPEMRRERVLEMRRIMESSPAELPYGDFLQTPYWYGLSAYMKALAGWRCQECGIRPIPEGRGLQVHHKTYAHRGFEYPDHLGDLEVLCEDCHARRHGK